MAKNEKAEAVESKANGEVLFEAMPKGFELPKRTKTGIWDDVIDRLQEKKGATVCLFRTSKDNAIAAYTKAKALKQAVVRRKAQVTVAVRVHDDQSCVFAQAN